MKDELITFETAKLAKEKGYKNNGLGKWYTKEGIIDLKHDKHGLLKTDFEAPTQSLLQRWLREKHKIRVYPKHGISGNFKFEPFIWDKPNLIGKWTRIGNIESYDTYEQALEKGLQEALKLIKND